jgi:NhaC family Na+:H+ antiporter
MSETEAPPRPLPLALAIAPIATLFAGIVGGAMAFGFGGEPLLLALLLAAAVATAIARRRGHGWAEVQAAAGRLLADALPAVLILVAIGALLGSWMFAGTIPLLVVLGIDLVSPQWMALTAFLATALMSVISGTSWGSAGTIGVAVMGAAEAMGLPLAPVAGAVVSGAYFGDKLSPISDMTNITAIGAGAELYAHIRHMLPTSLPPALIALVVFAFLTPGAPLAGAGPAVAVRAELVTLFAPGWWAALPLVVALAGIALRYPPAPVIVGSAVVALVVGVAVNGFPAAAGVHAFVGGFALDQAAPAFAASDRLAGLVERGGMVAMAPTLIYILAAFLLAAAMEVSGALDALLSRLLGAVRGAFGLVAATMAAGVTMVGMTSHGGVTSLVVGGLFRPSYAERGLAPENLGRALADSVTITEPLMPWTVSALFMASTLGVATLAYAPWAVFCWLGPVFGLLMALRHRLTGRGLKPA